MRCWACWVVVYLVTAGAAAAQAGGQDLQSAVARAMAGKTGTAVVLEVATGRVLAAYHPEVAARRVAHPGSSLKTFTLLALLEAGKVNGQTALMCKRPLTIAGHRLDCTHPDTDAPLDAATALAYSCNSYFTQVATRLTPAELRNSLIKDGFASATGMAANEAAGTVALAGTPTELQLQAIGEWGMRGDAAGVAARVPQPGAAGARSTMRSWRRCLPDWRARPPTAWDAWRNPRRR